jgi:hypothetical protein
MFRAVRLLPLLRRAALISLLILVSAALTGCQPLVEVVQPATPVASPVAVAPEERGVAIMGVDFDPPLAAGQLLASGGVTLLVAVENQGQIVEPTVRVTARLIDPDAPARAGDLANETVIVKSLDSRELRIVRFTQVTELPVRDHYKLVVEVMPLPGERERGDNVKTYDILVRAVE